MVSDAHPDFSSPHFEPRINFLSDAAKFELWHQRLGHIGKSKLELTHKHCDGVPKLRGNAFYKCPACMAGKLCTKNPVRNANLGTTSTPSSSPLPQMHQARHHFHLLLQIRHTFQLIPQHFLQILNRLTLTMTLMNGKLTLTNYTYLMQNQECTFMLILFCPGFRLSP